MLIKSVQLKQNRCLQTTIPYAVHEVFQVPQMSCRTFLCNDLSPKTKASLFEDTKRRKIIKSITVYHT